MRRWIPLVLLVLSACEACAAAPVPRTNYSRQVEYVTHESSVRVLVYCLDGSGGLGSGTAVSADLIVTAKHVIEGCGPIGVARISAVTLDGIDHPVLVSTVAREGIDVATLIATEVSPFKVHARLAWQMPGRGDLVCWVGGDGTEANRGNKKCGYYEGPRFPDDGYDIVSGKTAPGNSGSGVFNDRGELIGVLVVGRWYPNFDFLTGIVPVDDWRGIV